MQLYKNGALQQQAFNGGSGHYSFDVQNIYGSYVTSIDSSQLPFTISCPDTGYYTSVISATDSFYTDEDFALKCKQGFDIGAFDIVRSTGIFRPASFHDIHVIAGDIAQLYGASCTDIAGQVQVVLSGPASYQGSSSATPPTVNGDTLTWTVADFSTINVFSAFVLNIQVDTFAQDGDQVCFDVTITPTIGDNNPANNALTYCFTVVNSYDPNSKEVYPAGDIDTLQEWLTYTINFQNMGSAPAEHIYVMDTLDSNLDESSIQLLSFSHENYTQVLEGGIIKFNFPNINLPDSLSDEPGSHGYIRYKIKLKENLPIGTTINNTAHIYFDFNPAVVTNTISNTIALPIIDGIAEGTNPTFKIFPNPSSTQLTISASVSLQGTTVGIYDLSGRELILETATQNAHTLNTESLSNGLYLVVVRDTQQNVLSRSRVVVVK